MVFNEDTAPQNLINVTSISRPKRVAFLVDPEKIENDDINQIIRYSITVWGGRYHAIIPASAEEIKPSWWTLLINVDPDIIYSFLTLSDNLVQRINKYILPTKIIEPDKRTQGSHPSRINTFEIRALDITDIPRFKWNSQDPIYKQSFFYIKESRENNLSNTFALRNFGTFPEVANFTPNSLFRDLPHKIINTNEMSPHEILENVLKKEDRYPRRLVMPSDFCQMYASRNYSLEFDSNTRGFHIVVGDHPLDAIYAWNRALNRDLILGRDVFWISKKHCTDDKLLHLLAQWINETFWPSETDRYGKVISYSIEEDLLQQVADKIINLVHFPFNTVKLNPDDFPCPKAHKYISRLYESDHDSQINKVPLSENKGLVGFQRPQFLLMGHPQFGWMVDLEIQYHPERYSDWTNIRPSWKLPKRIGLAGKFFSPYAIESRVIKSGLPSLAITSETKNIHINIPSDHNVVWTWLERYSNRTRERAPDPPVSPTFSHFRLSDKGKYLQGLLRLFGNIYSAGSTFEDPFWRNILLWMAGCSDSQNNQELRKERAIKALNSFFDNNPVSLEKDSPDLNKLAEELVRNLTFRDSEPQPLRKEQLKGRFAELRGKELRKCLNNNYWEAYKKFDEYREGYLQNLLEIKVLLQGAGLACPHCGTRQWYVVDDLSSDMRCNGCLFHFSLTSSPEWSFRLNDLINNALRKHGTLAVLQTLYKLQQMISEMFLFLPCQDIFKKTNEKEPFTDLDIIVIKEGQFIIGEVKSDPGGFKQSDFDNLKEVGNDLVPDRIILAAPGDSWPREFLEKVNKLGEDLKPLDIEVSPMLLKW